MGLTDIVGHLARVPRLLRLFAALDVAWMLRDLRFFAISLVSDVVTVVASVTTVWLLAERFDGIGPWTRWQIVFMLGYSLVVTGLLETFFGYNVLFISRRIGRGQLDHVLVQPQPVWLTLATEGFSPCVGLPVAVPGAAVMVWAATHLTLPLSWAWAGALLVCLASSSAVVLAFSVVVGSLAFVAPRAAEEINSSSWRLIVELRSFPLDGVGLLLRAGLLSVVPVGFVAWYPCRLLLGIDAGLDGVLVVAGAGATALALALFVFTRGMHHYGRTGSQRYLDFGHRR